MCEPNDVSLIDSKEPLRLFELAFSKRNYEILQVAVSNLIVIAKHLGPERTRDELMSYVYGAIKILSDKPLFSILNQLEKFLILIGGEDYINIILYIFKIIFDLKSELIKEKAFTILEDIICMLSPTNIENSVIPFIKEATNHKDSFVRIGSGQLIFVVYSKVNEVSAGILRDIFQNIIKNDPTPLVREEYAQAILIWGKDFNTSTLKYICDEYFIEKLTHDSHEPVRIIVIDLIIYLSKVIIHNDVHHNSCLTIMLNLSKDTSWKVRQYVAMNVINLLHFKNKAKIMEIFNKGFKDCELEVCKTAVDNLVNFCQILLNYPETFNRYFEKDICQNIEWAIENESTRLSMAKNLVAFCWKFEKNFFKVAILKTIKKVINNTTRTEFIESIMKNFEQIPNNINRDDFIHNSVEILETLLNKTRDSKIKREIVIPILQLLQKCEPEHFKIPLTDLYLKLLRDNNINIHRTATLIYPVFIKYYSMDAIQKNLLPIFDSVFKEKPETALFMINELIFPTINLPYPNNDNEIYLRMFKSYVTNKNLSIIQSKLLKIIKLNNTLQELLSRENIINHSHYKEIKKQMYFSGNTLLFLQNTLKQNIFDINENEVEDDFICYLEKVLILIIQVFLETVKNAILSSPNEQKIMFFLSNIQTFSDIIKREEKQSWISDVTKKISYTEKREIDMHVKKLRLSSIKQGGIIYSRSESLI